MAEPPRFIDIVDEIHDSIHNGFDPLSVSTLSSEESGDINWKSGDYSDEYWKDEETVDEDEKEIVGESDDDEESVEGKKSNDDEESVEGEKKSDDDEESVEEEKKSDDDEYYTPPMTRCVPLLGHEERKEVLQKMQRSVSCAVCMLLYVKPRMLNCYHSFCTQCLVNVKIERTITCPKCSAVTTLSIGSIYALPLNHDLMETVNNLQEFFNLGLESLLPLTDEGIPENPPQTRVIRHKERTFMNICDLLQQPSMETLVRIKLKNWFEVGIHLGLPESELHAILSENVKRREVCSREMYAFWLRYVHRASYRNLAIAMELAGENPVIPLTPPKGPIKFTTKSKSAKKRARLACLQTKEGTRTPELKDLLLIPVKDWYTLGLLLGMRDTDLSTISIDNDYDDTVCRRAMFSRWLATQPSATFSQLRDALRWVDVPRKSWEIERPSTPRSSMRLSRAMD